MNKNLQIEKDKSAKISKSYFLLGSNRKAINIILFNFFYIFKKTLKIFFYIQNFYEQNQGLNGNKFCFVFRLATFSFKAKFYDIH